MVRVILLVTVAADTLSYIASLACDKLLVDEADCLVSHRR